MKKKKPIQKTALKKNQTKRETVKKVKSTVNKSKKNNVSWNEFLLNAVKSD